MRVLSFMIIATLGCAAFGSEPLLLQKGKFTPESQSISIPLDSQDAAPVGVLFDAPVAAGRVTMRVLANDGTELSQKSGESHIIWGKVFDDGPSPARIEITGEQAEGKWSVLAMPHIVRAPPSIYLATGPMMMLVALGFVLYWRRKSGVKWRWFWAGAAIWTVGVGLKFAVAAFTYERGLWALESSLPYAVYILIGGIFIGLYTGVFEIGVTLGFGLMWKRLAANWQIAVAVGVGAGAFEAFLLGMASLAGTMFASSIDMQVIAMNYMIPITPLGWLAGPFERILAIMCHVSSRTWVLLAVATRRWSYFWYGFLLLTALDTVAGFLYAADIVGEFNMWWLEGGLVPFAIISVPIINACRARWPEEKVAETQQPAHTDANDSQGNDSQGEDDAIEETGS